MGSTPLATIYEWKRRVLFHNNTLATYITLHNFITKFIHNSGESNQLNQWMK